MAQLPDFHRAISSIPFCLAFPYTLLYSIKNKHALTDCFHSFWFSRLNYFDVVPLNGAFSIDQK